MTERIDFNVEKDGFSAHFYPGTKKPGKVIIYTGGAGCPEKVCVRAGRFLVREGYSVMILGFYLWKGLPKELHRIPVDYVERAAKWLNVHGYTEICLMGTSTGAGYTLLCASLVPAITKVIAVVPFDYVMESMKKMVNHTGTSVYEYHGKDMPYSTYPLADKGGLRGALREVRKMPGYGLKYFMRAAYDTAILNPDSRIRVENINGDILFIHPDWDDSWPSETAVKRMKKVLEESGFPHTVKSIEYPGASHALGSWEDMPLKFRFALRFACTRDRENPKICKEARKKSTRDILDELEIW
jgi:dienelactone hydrolase